MDTMKSGSRIRLPAASVSVLLNRNMLVFKTKQNKPTNNWNLEMYRLTNRN